MKKTLLITSDASIVEKVKQTVSSYLIVKDSIEAGRQVMNYELPDITILNFADPSFDSAEILSMINDDPWLHCGGLVAIHNQAGDSAFIDSLKSPVLVIPVAKRHIGKRLGTVLKILENNESILFQRDFQQNLMTNLSGSFLMNNDPFEAAVYASLLSLYLFNANLINIDMRDNLRRALVELLMNAIEHGNCGI